MRAIKFRAWADGRMHEDISMVTDHSYNGIVPHKGTLLMQFTGLSDKNGVEIYEGDLLQGTPEADEAAAPICEVVWSNERAQFLAPYTNDLGRSFNIPINMIQDEIVIGNIYQHTHLLQEGENK